MERHEAVVGHVYDAVEAGVEGEDDYDDEPAGDEVDEEADFVVAEPAPYNLLVSLIKNSMGSSK